ncbi:MAG: hypothetical protein ACR2IF_05945 [Terriglobales bacterium]
MGLFDKLRKAEEQSRGAAHRGFEKARETWDDAQRQLRRKMRVHPRPKDATPEPLPFSATSPAATSGPAAIESLPHRAGEEDAA